MKSAWMVAADIIAPPEDDWRALPHQIAPEGRDWFVWMLLGGRGSGKTAAAARYMHEHLSGPPCLPHVPGGHWGAIIAPTLGDGVTSCVNGPSGLRAHQPNLKLRATPGGTLVTYPNGAQCKLFGAHTPEDVERLRSGGNRCFVSGTRILTSEGWQSIETIEVGSLAWTRFGWLPIDRAGMTSRAERIWEVHLTTGTIRCTGDHKFMVRGRGWTEAKNLRPDDTMVAWDEEDTYSPTSPELQWGSPYSSMESPGLQTEILHGTIEVNKDFYTSMFGRNSTDPFLSDMKSTISMETLATTDKRTSSASPQQSIAGCMPFDLRSGIAWARNLGGPMPNRKNTPAWSAGKNFGHIVKQNVVRSLNAGRQGQTVLELEEPELLFATLAAKSFSQGAKTPVTVLRTVETNGVEPVYCIRVPGPNEVFVEGVLSAQCFVWAEELAAWRYMDDCWQHMRYGLRVGPRPHVVVSTTPKSRRLIKALIKGEHACVTTHATTADNPYLDSRVKKDLYDDYEGTRLGRQELLGQLLEDIEGALWKPSWIEESRVPFALSPDNYDVIVVGVDPSGSKGGDETGIVVCALVRPGGWYNVDARLSEVDHGFVLADYSMRGTTADWAKQAIKAYEDWEANYIVAEINFGGEMVKHSIQVYDTSIPVKVAHASRGKDQRAEPVANLYEKGRVHHVGSFPELEEQMTTWDAKDPDDSWSPDRMDAMVWGIHTLLVAKTRINQSQADDYRLAGRR